MKTACLLVLTCGLASAQYIGPLKIIVPTEDGRITVTTSPGLESTYVSSFDAYFYSITEDANGNKYFNFYAERCVVPLPTYSPDDQVTGDGLFGYLLAPPVASAPAKQIECDPLSQSQAEKLGPIASELSYFYSLKVYPPAQHIKAYSFGAVLTGSAPLGKSVPASNGAAPQPRLTSVSPQPDPQMVFLDGLGDQLVRFDLSTFAMTSQVTVPSTSGVLAIRHTATGPENEVWVSNGVPGITVADLGSQQVLSTIDSPGVPIASTPVGIVFVNDGSVAFELLRFGSQDSSGNNAALLLFDATARKLVSTTLLKDRPTALLIAPDGLTLYILDDVGKLTYYDILSGSADLSVSTFTPGQPGGYSGSSSVFIHPDGTRLFWNTGVNLEVFDLTLRKVTKIFPSGLPTTSAASMRMSVDGSQVVFGNGEGTNAILDTRSGTVLSTFTAAGPSLHFGGLPVN